MKKSEATTQYTESSYKIRPISVNARREIGTTLTPTYNAEQRSWIVDDKFPRELSMKQWSEDKSRSSIQRDAALGYCSLKFYDAKHTECEETEAVLVEVVRPYRRLNGAMSITSLLSATKNKTRKGKSEKTGTERAVSDYTNAIIFDPFNGEREMWTQLLTKAERFYGKDEFVMELRLVDQITYHVDAAGGFDVTIDIWEFVPEEAEIVEEVTEEATAE